MISRFIDADDGQMSVELAVIMPVAIVVALAIANIMAFLDCCTRFDRASLDAVIAHGVSPSGTQSSVSAVSGIESALAEAMGEGEAITVEVSSSSLASDPGELLSMAPHLVRYTCTMRFRPWPRHLVIAGAVVDAPFEIEHTRTLVVDRYRPGVVI